MRLFTSAGLESPREHWGLKSNSVWWLCLRKRICAPDSLRDNCVSTSSVLSSALSPLGRLPLRPILKKSLSVIHRQSDTRATCDIYKCKTNHFPPRASWLISFLTERNVLLWAHRWTISVNLVAGVFTFEVITLL